MAKKMKKAASASNSGGAKSGDTYRFIDLFAGIGGFHYAFKDLGCKCVFASEWDDAARKTYEHNHRRHDPELFESDHFARDITKVVPESIPDFDILTAGFPCQPFSQAGKKKGFEDVRGTLFFNVAEILRVKQPAAFFLENVRHLQAHDGGRTFARIQEVITQELGYSFAAKVVKASDFGLPQHRPRLFMVGFRKDILPEDFEFNFPQPQKDLRITMEEVWGAKQCNRKIGFTLRVGGRASGIHDRRNWDMYMVDGKVKKLGPEQGKLMMGLPRTFEFPSDMAETQKMKQLGNSVAVDAIKATGGRILSVLSERSSQKVMTRRGRSS
jgi:DNA (cytosine-5)-methyltransferase 1